METDVYVQASETYFGRSPCRIKTLLGSCVAVTVWHPALHIGGLCHYLLANREGAKVQKTDTSNYKYGENALAFLTQKMQAHAAMKEYKLGLFGGANMYKSKASPSIGEKNIMLAKKWGADNGVNFEQVDILENVCRTIVLDLDIGEVQLKRYRQESN